MCHFVYSFDLLSKFSLYRLKYTCIVFDYNIVLFNFSHPSSPTIFSGNYYGNGTGAIWISELGCWGTEDDLGQCDFAPWGINNCNHDQDVSIDCGVYLSFLC